MKKNTPFKKHTVNILCLLLLSFFLASSCEKPVESHPIDVLFTEYSLTRTSCQWKELSDNHTVVIINSREKLETYLECTVTNYPAIDFSKYTLLLAYGVESNLVTPNYTSLQRRSAQRYVMQVGLLPFLHNTITYWHVPIIVNRINDNSVIELIVTENPPMESTVWKYTNEFDEVIIELIFYPAENKLHIKSTPEELPPYYYMIRGNRIVEYCMVGNKMYWALEDGSFPFGFLSYWNIFYPTEDEMIMRYEYCGGFMNCEYRFIRQIN